MDKRPHKEPDHIDVSTTGTHATGNSLHTKNTLPETEGLIWIEADDQAKQGKANKGDPLHAQAAPDHPHFSSTQGGRS
jgi:hypothetical protein